jgi:dUTP pyrophosphatase
MMIPSDRVEVKIFRYETMRKLNILTEDQITRKEFNFPYMTEKAAAFDIYAVMDEPLTIHCNMIVSIPSGIGFQILDERISYCALLMLRSGVSRTGLYLTNAVGLIDGDYQGELMCSIGNRDPDLQSFTVNPGDRIAQCTIVPIYKIPQGRIVDEYSRKTTRGAGGFGHTGQ